MASIGYIPFHPHDRSSEAQWVAKHLGAEIKVFHCEARFNLNRNLGHPPVAELIEAIRPLARFDSIIAEGIGGFLWAAVLRSLGSTANFVILPYVNPSCWHDIGCIAAFRNMIGPADLIFVGSRRSAEIYRNLGIAARVGEPFGIDAERFRLIEHPWSHLNRFQLPHNRFLFFAGRIELDKSIHTLLRAFLKLQILFPDLQLVLASHHVDEDYLALLKPCIDSNGAIHVIRDPCNDELPALYNAASAFVTAATSYYETFGRSPVEALACGTVAIAPDYDGFCDTLQQPGGILVNVVADGDRCVIDENALLRALFHALTSPSPPRSQIANQAAERFSRSRTLNLFGSIRKEDAPAVETNPSPQRSFSLPVAWTQWLSEHESWPLERFLEAFLEGMAARSLSAHDDDLQCAVNRALAAPWSDNRDYRGYMLCR